MASRTTVTLIDDLDESTKGVRTVSVSLDGRVVELDLSEANYDKLQQALAPYLAAGRKIKPSTSARRGSTAAQTAAGKREDTEAVREWAETHGHPVNSGGPIKREIIDAYQAAHA